MTIEDNTQRSIRKGQWGPKTEEEARRVSEIPVPIFITTSEEGAAIVWDVASGKGIVSISPPSEAGSKRNSLLCALPVAGGEQDFA